MSVTLPQVNEAERAAALLRWYDANRRVLPWRVLAGEAPDPYAVWLSEIMLQQTTVAAVGKFFAAFTRRWPRVEDLAGAELDDVLREWAGLGYYARARNLHACARVVAHELGGRFPQTEAELQKLPGIGPYTSAAIAAIAFNQPAAAVDANVERVISRLHAITTPLPASKPEIKSRTLELVPHTRPGDFAQALMDLGATICTPSNPNCAACPLEAACVAKAKGIAATLPRKQPKKPRPVRRGHVYWLEDGKGAVLMRRRPDKGLLGGMLEFPSGQWAEAEPETGQGAPVRASWQRAGNAAVEHTFTHFHLVLDVFVTETITSRFPDGEHHWRWIAKDELASQALPTLMKKVAVAVLGDKLQPKRSKN